MSETWGALADPDTSGDAVRGAHVVTDDRAERERLLPDGGVRSDRVLVYNPVSGNGDHREEVRELADRAGFTVLETQAGGEAVAFARLAADAGADLVAAAGGDGTVNEVARGLDAADALSEVTFGVVPTGTGNNFAGNLGIESIEHAFEVLADGERRRIDVATAGRDAKRGDELFLNSCIAGLTAEASASTSPELKDRLGMLAYVVTGLRTLREFDALPLAVEADCPGADKAWTGDAVMVLVGNARRFPAEGRSQANCEDGLLEVTIIERMPPADLLQEAAIHRLFGDETEHVTRLLAPELQVDVRRDDPVGFSFDGEIAEYQSLTIGTRERVLEIPVGESYEPNPEGR
ncbi:diacylglycerol kinase family lipid kinase [Halorussus gelatinilyticus]|uniref:Diacylglycerol kinase family lipid kinase n=1 Tax=Halorussus gelatinilyticus TaxID=2937524 RepID=A0A8U0IK18_9EURY|nr:diacylglycerol kinase family protein [Halorussus gelatinilyticus]UPW01108.1 diacylglycerol kinase family lipid kinase [Halorussus gelatinilyticus]